MPSAKITSKGQITVPKAVRERLNVGPGDRVLFRERADGTFVVEPERRDVMMLAGSVKVARRGISLERMEAAVQEGAVSRQKRTRRK
jgi:AbrB family looped-hinge helix DNA binding protein